MASVPPPKAETFWSPTWAPHVTTSYAEETDPETGEREPQRIVARCENCGTDFRCKCPSGRAEQRVIAFAFLHRDCPPKEPTP
ncbi:MAG TPA: hypothetical protein VGI39_39175 [Polyangiaceae bacterium]|jgi:hypothetical protein